MSGSQLVIVLLCCLPLAACLCCYTCLFPAISPLDCFKFPQECPAGQRCLSSTAMGKRGSLQMTMYEKSCAVPSQCGVSGQKYASGLSNYTNICRDTDLCNGAESFAALSWGGAALCTHSAAGLNIRGGGGGRGHSFTPDIEDASDLENMYTHRHTRQRGF